MPRPGAGALTPRPRALEPDGQEHRQHRALFRCRRGRPRAGALPRGAERRRRRRPGRRCWSGSRSCCAPPAPRPPGSSPPTARGGAAPQGLAAFQDELIRLVYDYTVAHVYRATNPSAAERMAIVATGGYGRGLLAPFSDVDLLFLLPYKQTPWGESVVEYMLYLLWDLGLKVGHATRTVDQSLKLARADMTIRTALLDSRLILGDEPLFERADAALPARGGARHGAPVRRGQARRARRAPPARRRIALPRRAQHQGRQGRPARPAHPALARQVPLRRRPRRRRGGGGDLHRRRVRHLPPLRGLPLDGALPPALPGRPGRGAPHLRRADRHGGAARAIRAPRPARGRALHEALLPGRQGRRRPHHHPVLGAGDRAGQAVARAGAPAQSAELARAAPHPQHRRFPHRQRPPQRRRRRGVQARPRQPHPLLRQGRGDGRLLPSRRRAPAAPVAAADRRQAAQRPGGQPHLPRHAVLGQEPGGDPAAHERGRRARPLRAGVRQGRVDDAVQHVPPLHGGRASDPHRRHALRHRARRGRRSRIRCRPRSSRPSRTGARSTWRRSCTTSPRGATRTTRWSARASPARSARASA